MVASSWMHTEGGKAMWREYIFPTSIEETLQILAEYNGDARIIAGGTDLVLQRQRGACPSSVAVDITRISALDYITLSGEYIEIGALVTHAQVAASPLIKERASVLAEACGQVGGPQIRNMGTLVGNVVNALPAADSAIALHALDAEAQVTQLDGSEWMPISSLYLGVGQCRVDPCTQMITALRFRPLRSSEGSAYERLAKRKSLILPILAVGAMVGIKDGRYSDARIGVGPVAPTPLRLAEVEDYLRGEVPKGETIAKAARMAVTAAHPRDSVIRGSSEYRRAMVGVLVRRALIRATLAAGFSLGKTAT